MSQDHPLTHHAAEQIRTLLAQYYRERSDVPLQELFVLCDTNEDGRLSSRELKQVMNAILDDVVRDAEVEAIMQKADSNHDGVIDQEEFLAAIKRMNPA